MAKISFKYSQYLSFISHSHYYTHKFHFIPITSTSARVSKLPTGEDGEVIDSSIFRWVETQFGGPPKVEGIEDSSYEKENVKQAQD